MKVYTIMASHNLDPSSTMDADEKFATNVLSKDQSMADGTMVSLSKLDPEIAEIISSLTPERRAEIEKKVKLKIDLILFPMLLIFYILNYIVSEALRQQSLRCPLTWVFRIEALLLLQSLWVLRRT
jgi:hypothetical protein